MSSIEMENKRSYSTSVPIAVPAVTKNYFYKTFDARF